MQQLGQLIEHQTGLTLRHARDLVEAEQLVHSCGRNDDLIEHGHAATDEARVSTLWHHCQPAAVAMLQDTRDLLGGRREQRHLAVPVVLVHPVAVARRQVRRIGHDASGTRKNRSKELEVTGCHLSSALDVRRDRERERERTCRIVPVQSPLVV